MDLRIAGRTVVITGASAGIGLACARVFAEEGCNVTLVARTEARLRDAAAPAAFGLSSLKKMS